MQLCMLAHNKLYVSCTQQIMCILYHEILLVHVLPFKTLPSESKSNWFILPSSVLKKYFLNIPSPILNTRTVHTGMTVEYGKHSRLPFGVYA